MFIAIPQPEHVCWAQADWSEKLGMPLKLSSSTYETKKLYHDLLREEHGMVPDKKKKA